MNITVFGTKHDLVHLTEVVEALPMLQYRKIQYGHAEDYDTLLRIIPKSELAIVMLDGAEGMEGVMLARRAYPNLKVLWFSSDPAFGAQAHRLGCTYFGTKPISQSAMEMAIRSAAI